MKTIIMTKDQLLKYYENHEKFDMIKNEIINSKKLKTQVNFNNIESPIIGRYKIIFINEKNDKTKHLYEYAKNISNITIFNDKNTNVADFSFKLFFDGSGSNTLQEIILKKDHSGDIIIKQINELNQSYFFIILKDYKINEIKISEINKGMVDIITSIEYKETIIINND